MKNPQKLPPPRKTTKNSPKTHHPIRKITNFVNHKSTLNEIIHNHYRSPRPRLDQCYH